MALIKAISGAVGFNDTLVYDNGALLSDDEEALLQSQLSALSTKYDISLVVVTVDTLGDKTDEEYADDFYDYNDYKDDGALCLLVFSESNAKGENKLYVSTKGTCISAFSDADIDEYCQRVLQYLSDRNFYSVFKEFTNFSDSELSSSGDNSDTNDCNYYSAEYYNSDEYKEYMKGYRIKQTLKHKRVELSRPKSFIFRILGRFSPCNTKVLLRRRNTRLLGN